MGRVDAGGFRSYCLLHYRLKGVGIFMGFLKRLFGGGGEPAERNVLHLYIKCNRCGTPVHVRVNLNNDLSADYGDNDAEGYTLSKEVMDDRCFRLMHAEVQFYSRRNELSRKVEGGTFISQEEWEATRRPSAGEERPASGG